jgi:hypothetical protein
MQLYNWQQQQYFQFACKFSNTGGKIDLHVIATHNPVSSTLKHGYNDLFVRFIGYALHIHWCQLISHKICFSA